MNEDKWKEFISDGEDNTPDCGSREVKYEEKFIVINRNAFAKNGVPDNLLHDFQEVIGKIEAYLPDNKYYVCNQDEPYAQNVIDTIIAGENAKALNQQ